MEITITIINVLEVANALLKIEMCHIQDRYHRDIKTFRLKLKNALQQYEYPKKEPLLEGGISYSIIDQFEHDIQQLITQTKAFFLLLTPGAKTNITKRFKPIYT